jgi:CubicO group peptidase (beta-lactamase class C family)
MVAAMGGGRRALLTASLVLAIVMALAGGSALPGTAVRAEALAQGREQGARETPDPTDPADVGAFLDEVIPRQMEAGHVVGATAAVVKDGQVVAARGYGYADLARQTPVSPERTLFYIGSAGKLFTWTAVMQLVEQGKLDLDADVNGYLDFQIPATYPAPIAMRHLLTHTAGFEEQLGALLAAPGEVLPLRDFLIRAMPRRIYPPGEYSAYSNYGTALAGYVVQRVSGEPFEQYLTRHILMPLEMSHSAAVQPLPAGLMAETSKGYRYRGGTYEATDFEWISGSPAAPIRATAADMGRFMLAHLEGGSYGGGQILRPETARLMHEQQFTHDPRLAGMAYGFVVSHENGRAIIWHDGDSARFATFLALIPRERVGLFVSFNTPGVDPHGVWSAFLDRYYPASGKTLPPPAADFATRAREYGGTYVPTRAASRTVQKIITWSGAVRIEPRDDGTLRLGNETYAEIEPGLFEQVDGERRLTFATDGRGAVTALYWGPLAFLKVPWYASLEVQLPILLGCLLALLSGVVAWPVEALIRRRRGKPGPGRTARLARWLAGLLGLTSVLLVGSIVALLLPFADTYFYPTTQLAVLERLLWLTVPLALGVAGLAVLAWRGRAWNLAWRLHYSLVGVAGLVFTWWLGFWELLG